MDVKDLLNLIKRRSKNLIAITNNINLFPLTLSDVKEAYRKELNLIKNAVIQYSNDEETLKTFIDSYNENISNAKKAGLQLKTIETPNPKVLMKDTIKDLMVFLTGNVKVSESVITGKVKYMNDFMKVINSKQGLAQIPRITLLKVGAYRADKKKFIRVKFPVELEGKINRMVNRGLAKGGSNKTIARSVLGEVNKTIPNDYFYYQTKKGMRKKLIENYAEVYARDFSTIQESKSIIASTIAAGGIAVKVAGPVVTDPICGKYVGNTYSIKGTKYPPLTTFPPFQPNCEHYLTSVYE